MLLSKENQAAKPFNRKHVGFSAPILQVPAPSLQRKIIAFILISGGKRKPSSEHRSWISERFMFHWARRRSSYPLCFGRLNDCCQFQISAKSIRYGYIDSLMESLRESWAQLGRKTPVVRQMVVS